MIEGSWIQDVATIRGLEGKWVENENGLDQAP